MKIIQVAPPSMPLPVWGYGGTQRVVYWLCQALRDLGHEVILAGPEGSVGDQFEVIELLPPSSDHIKDADIVTLKRKLPSNVDFIHFHCWRQKVRKHFMGGSIPFLCSVHGGSGETVFEDLPTCFASLSQRRNYDFPEAFVQYHPINMNAFAFWRQSGDYLLFLGKPTWSEKGLIDAQRVAAEVDWDLRVAGPDYVGPGAVGEVGGKWKSCILGHAYAVLIPTVLPEAFCLVAAEAMACGTPVIAYKSGALPEVIGDGISGFLVDDVEGMVEAVSRVPQLSRLTCRRWVEDHFESHLVARKFLEIYTTVKQRWT